MAEEIVVSPLIKVLLHKLGSKLFKELRLSGDAKNAIKKLKSILSKISDVLEDAEKISYTENYPRDWLKKLKDAAYDVDDVVDEYQFEALRRRMETQHRLKKRVGDFFSYRNPIIISHRIAHRTRDVLKRLDDIAAEGTVFHLMRASVSTIKHYERDKNSTLIDFKILGRDDDLERILNFLNHEGNDKDIGVLSIVGLGGVGKTALAKLAYNDDRIETQFDLKFWVCVSDEFDVKEITRKLIECIKKEACDNLQFAALRKVIEEIICGKRFFLVLDDVWNDDYGKWESLLSLLNWGSHGSKIVVTTRSEVVANVMGSFSVHYLKGLSYDDCWTLFRQSAFGLQVRETPELIKIGKGIVEKCGGLPLAVKALGSLMGTKNREFEWLAILKSEEWILAEDGNILPALKLSYFHLPSHLKQCLIYCSLFPRNYEFDKKKLISLWISEGFVTSLYRNSYSEDIGTEYFNNLLSRSFFQDAVKDDFGDILSCKIHNLMHDLACIMGKDEFFVSPSDNDMKLPDNCRFLSLVIDSLSPDTVRISTKAKRVRSLLFLGTHNNGIPKMVDLDLIVQLRHLRVLSFSKLAISIFPSTICKLKHLRFLDLSDTNLQTVDLLITNLYNLQFLDLSNTMIEVLPCTIARLSNLRSLNIRKCSMLQELPSAFGKLENLRFLDLSYTSIRALPESISGLRNLQVLYLTSCLFLQRLPLAFGKLGKLRLLDLSQSTIQALPELIKDLHNLKILNLRNCCKIQGIPEGIQNMSNLNHLDLSGCELASMPCGLGKLCNLQTLPLFIAGEEHGIEELEHLYNIRGQLKITCLGNINDPLKAKEAYMEEKSGLHSLELKWRAEHTSQWEEVVTDQAISTPAREDIDVGILASMQPHPNIKHLTIEDYDGSTFPTWLTEADLSSTLPNLESLSLYNLDRCTSLPPLGQLPALKHLQIESMYKIKRIGFLAGTFSLLVYLKLWNLPDLEEWLLKDREMFPSLVTLIIVGCPKLKINARLPSSLVELEMASVNKEILARGCLYGLSKLRKLKISHFGALESLWETMKDLRAIQTLKIVNCYLSCLPDCILQQHYPSLWFIELTLNNGLKTLGKGQGGEPPLLFTAVRHLIIEGCDELTALPDWLGKLTFLESLKLSYCNNLASLQHGLPAQLTQLTLRGCPILERSCEMTTGEDWPMIAHIPQISIYR